MSASGSGSSLRISPEQDARKRDENRHHRKAHHHGIERHVSPPFLSLRHCFSIAPRQSLTQINAKRIIRGAAKMSGSR